MSDAWVYADFNGFLQHDLLCIAHADTLTDSAGRVVVLREGLALTAFDDDIDDLNRPDKLIATGVVVATPASRQCSGSRWCLLINADGVRHESDLASRD